MRTLLAVLALVCASSTPALAQDPAPLVSDTAPAVAPIALSPAEIAALVKAAQAGATAAPAAQPAPAAISENGVFGLGWASIGSILAALLAGIFAFWKGSAASRVQKALPDLMDAAYWFVERNFGDLPGPQKAMVAMGQLYQGMTGHGFVLDPKSVAAAQTRWSLLAAQSGAAPVVAVMPMPAPVPPADLAAAKANAAVAAQGGTATDLANAAAAPK